MNLAFIRPAMEHLADLEDFRKEFAQQNEYLHGGSNLATAKDLAIWVINVERNQFKSAIDNGWVPSSVSLVYRLDDNKLVGILDMRHELNEVLLDIGGHIGYSVRKSERLKGYGTHILNTAKEGAKELQIEQLLVTCDARNIASKKVIQNAGGVLENIHTYEGKDIERYWITI